ncbi:MerR family transcriptional regulator [Streptosporangium sp. NPDC002721]|uniref:MerR family transcriptional regulator n=1 Tax=Streptosporangium sp. NPDC002721 TaxID=3366188 RepID=UPI0036ABBAC0
MAWSTSELATLAGTTVNTIRHYHRLGLLEEPDRRYNGYKQYETLDLVRLLRIRRLAELGVPLSRIKELSTGSPVSADFDALPADADEATRQNLAEKYAPSLVRTLRNCPWMDNDAMAHVSKGKSVTRQTFIDALRELHNEAQFDVIHRAKELARRQLRAEG